MYYTEIMRLFFRVVNSIFEKRGFLIKGMFDNNPALQGKQVRGMTIRSTEELESFIKENNIE